MNLKLEDMTVEQKIGMILCARRFDGEDLEFVLEMIRKRALGCVQAPVNRHDIVKLIKDTADEQVQ